MEAAHACCLDPTCDLCTPESWSGGRCSFWARQLGREADEDIGPTPAPSQEEAEAQAQREDAEDRADPPCGKCPDCLACLSDDDGPPPDWFDERPGRFWE